MEWEWGGGGGGEDYTWARGTFGRDGYILRLDRGVGFPEVCAVQQSAQPRFL